MTFGFFFIKLSPGGEMGPSDDWRGWLGIPRHLLMWCAFPFWCEVQQLIVLSFVLAVGSVLQLISVDL